MYEDIYGDGKDFFYIASVADLVESVGREFLNEWIVKRIAKGMKSTSIRIKEGETKNKLDGDSPENYRKIRYAPKGFKMPYTMFIYGKKVAFISTKKELFGFIVESADMATSMRLLFDVVWNTSSEK